jgi:AAA family ATP:ADP antiporter
VLAIVMAFQAAQRTANYAISNPAREVLFTVADREDKYKANNVVDGVLFRGADVGWAWIFTLMFKKVAMSIPTIAALTVPAMLGWAGLSLALGRMQEKRARQLQSS